MTVGSLFAGIGGFDLGFERAGFEIKWQVEIDPFCRAVLAKHWPDVRRYVDVRGVRAEIDEYDARRCACCLKPVDVVCGGFPCQPVSIAGKRLAQSDERWLWPQFLRIVCELRPRYVVMENVPGLFTAGFGDVLGSLAAIGFDAEWDCLPASAFGAPHQRDRIWVVAYSDDQREPQPQGGQFDEWRRSIDRREALAESSRNGLEGTVSAGNGEYQAARIFTRRAVTGGGLAAGAEQWRTEPDVGRVAHGVPARVDRLRGLGNSIVPQIAEWIARRILEAEGEVMAASTPAAEPGPG